MQKLMNLKNQLIYNQIESHDLPVAKQQIIHTIDSEIKFLNYNDEPQDLKIKTSYKPVQVNHANDCFCNLCLAAHAKTDEFEQFKLAMDIAKKRREAEQDMQKIDKEEQIFSFIFMSIIFIPIIAFLLIPIFSYLTIALYFLIK
jgi:hypothetical protein